MSGMKRSKRYAALMIAVVFTLVTVISTFSVPVYAAGKTPSKVSGLKATARSNYSVRLTWNKTKNAKKYQIYRAGSRKGKYRKISTVTGKSFLDSNLKKGTKYYYKVRAVNGSRKGGFSKVGSATTKKSSLYDVTVDKTAKTVTISAILNGRYFNESTRHLIIDRSGFNKGKAILSSYCTPDDLYNGLVKAGGKSWSRSEDKTLKMGEKNTKSNAENKNYSKIDVSISWGNETHSLDECLTTEKNGAAAPEIDMIFSGNPKAAARTPSGCVTCMDSCYIGIVANSAYGLCVIDNGEPTLYARPDVLPPDKTVVKVIFRIK